MIKNRILQNVGLTTALVCFAGIAAQAATVDLQLIDSTSKAQTGFTATVPSGSINANELIGIYKFDAGNPNGMTIADPFWSVCLSPSGLLDTAKHNYTEQGFGPAAPGQNPATWAAGSEGDAGIQNAQYLWRLFSPGIIASGNKNEGSGLALAIYEALYDSTGYGNLGGSSFTVNTWAGSGVQSYYNTYLAALNPTVVAANIATGYILRSTTLGEYGAGQDLMFNATPVPEPSTIIAGALLLLPFGASTLRKLRKNA